MPHLVLEEPLPIGHFVAVPTDQTRNKEFYCYSEILPDIVSGTGMTNGRGDEHKPQRGNVIVCF